MVPGGIGTRALLADERLLGWIAGAHATSARTTSVCTGSHPQPPFAAGSPAQAGPEIVALVESVLLEVERAGSRRARSRYSAPRGHRVGYRRDGRERDAATTARRGGAAAGVAP